MRLRHKLLLSFLLFGVLPLLAMGTRSYVRSTRALEGLISQETSQIAAKVARELEDRLDLQESDEALLGGNEATTRLLRARAAGRGEEARTAEQDMRAYSAEVWSSIREDWHYTDEAPRAMAPPAAPVTWDNLFEQSQGRAGRPALGFIDRIRIQIPENLARVALSSLRVRDTSQTTAQSINSSIRVMAVTLESR